MSSLLSFIRNSKTISVILSVLITILFVFAVAQAATTISTDVVTGGGLNASSSIAVDGPAIFNNTTADSDFRIGSDTDENMFYLNAGTETIGIASSTPWGLLSVEATSTVGAAVPMFVVSDQGTSTPAFYITGNDGSVGLGTTSPSATPLGVVGDAYISSGLGVGTVITTDGRIVASVDLGVASTAPSATLGVTGDAYITSGLGVGVLETTDGRIIANTDLGVATTSPSDTLGVSGDVYVTSAATTTVVVESTGTDSEGGCLQMRATDGTTYRVYLVATTTADYTAENVVFQIEAGACQ